MSLSTRSSKLRELLIFAMLGTIMFISKKLLEFAPNIHLVGVLTIAYTVVYRQKALIPIYVYVFLDGLFGGFASWWIPYTYVWTILWGATMLLPKKMPKNVAQIVYALICALHGALFEFFYIWPMIPIFKMTLPVVFSTLVAGIGYDAIHAASNFAGAFLILPLVDVMQRLDRQFIRKQKQ